MLERLNSLRQLLAGAAALVAVYMYGVAYFAVSRYYDAFGLTPADAGVTQSTLVALALTGFSLLFGGFAIAGLAALAARHFVMGGGDSTAFLSPRAKAALVVGIILVLGGLKLVEPYPAWALTAAAVGSGVGLGATTSERRASWSGFWVRAGACGVVVLSWVFFVEVTTATERLATKVMYDGGLREASGWETLTSMALGIPRAPAYRHDLDCAVVIARSGDHAWLMTSPGETVVIERVDRKDVKVRYSTAPSATSDAKPRPCWRNR